MKPSWQDAPTWANWLAKDEDNLWYWYEYMPSLELNYEEGWWYRIRGETKYASPGSPDDIYFADSIEQRPT